MPRHLVVGNGKFLVNLDEHAYVRDVYYPYVGQLNHTAGYPSRLGVWVEGQFSWLGDPEWNIRLAYQEDSLVTDVTAEHEGLGIVLHMNDAVHQRDSIYLKRIVISNGNPNPREVRLFSIRICPSMKRKLAIQQDFTLTMARYFITKKIATSCSMAASPSIMVK